MKTPGHPMRKTTKQHPQREGGGGGSGGMMTPRQQIIATAASPPTSAVREYNDTSRSTSSSRELIHVTPDHILAMPIFSLDRPTNRFQM